MIDWKSIPKIDAHIHRLPPDVIENNRGNGDRFVEYGSVDDYLRLMDQYHIEAACVMPFNDPYMLSMDFQAGSAHNNLLAMCLQAENCLFCFADIDIRNPVETTLELLEKALEQKEFLGVKIHPTNTGYPVGGAYYDRVFAWADQSRVPSELSPKYKKQRRTTMDSVKLAVNGTLMRGLPLEKNLLDAGAFFLREAATAPCYRLWSINDNNPAMLRVDPADPQAVSVAVEVWQVPAAGLASVLMKEPEGLSVGKVALSDGEVVLGVIGEPELVRGQKEISSYGGWRSYIASL